MRKKYILVTLFTAVILIVCLVIGIPIIKNNKAKIIEKDLKEYEATLELVKDINHNSDFGGLELLKFSDESGENQQFHGGYDFSSKMEKIAEGGVEGIYFNYPKDSSDYRLANISIAVIPYHVYSVAVGQNLRDAIFVLKEKGFTEYEINRDKDADFIFYRQLHVSINLKVSKDTEIIQTITVSVYDKEDTMIY